MKESWEIFQIKEDKKELWQLYAMHYPWLDTGLYKNNFRRYLRTVGKIWIHIDYYIQIKFHGYDDSTKVMQKFVLFLESFRSNISLSAIKVFQHKSHMNINMYTHVKLHMCIHNSKKEEKMKPMLMGDKSRVCRCLIYHSTCW